MKVGQTIEGEALKITNYGVLVKLDENFNGFLPLSEFGLTGQGDTKPADILKVGDKIQVAIVSIDTRDYRIMLTLQKN